MGSPFTLNRTIRPWELRTGPMECPWGDGACSRALRTQAPMTAESLHCLDCRMDANAPGCDVALMPGERCPCRRCGTIGSGVP